MFDMLKERVRVRGGERERESEREELIELANTWVLCNPPGKS